MDTENEQVAAYRAEIERLKFRVKALVSTLVELLQEIRASDRALIIELCDALAYWRPSDDELLRRAREATR